MLSEEMLRGRKLQSIHGHEAANSIHAWEWPRTLDDSKHSLLFFGVQQPSVLADYPKIAIACRLLLCLINQTWWVLSLYWGWWKLNAALLASVVYICGRTMCASSFFSRCLFPSVTVLPVYLPWKFLLLFNFIYSVFCVYVYIYASSAIMFCSVLYCMYALYFNVHRHVLVPLATSDFLTSFSGIVL